MMRQINDRILRLRTAAGGDILLMLRSDVSHFDAQDLGTPTSPNAFIANLSRWFARSTDRAALDLFMRRNNLIWRHYLAPGAAGTSSSRATIAQLQEDLARALGPQGQVLCFYVPQRRVIHTHDTGVDPIGPQDTADAQDPDLKWIAFEVKDAAGNPFANASFLLTLPDGSHRDGTLDGDGKVRLDRIPPGQCKFSLVDLDQSEWKPAMAS